MPAAQPKMIVRDSQGRFAKGNRGGPGNPFARQAAKLKAVFLECLSVEKMKALVNTLIDAAIDGNMTAAKLVLQYSLGKPTAGVDVCNPIPVAGAAPFSPSAASPTCQSHVSGSTGPARSSTAAAASADLRSSGGHTGNARSPRQAGSTPAAMPKPPVRSEAAVRGARPAEVAAIPPLQTGTRACASTAPQRERRGVVGSHGSGTARNPRVRPTRPPIANGFSATGGTGDCFDNLLTAKELCDRTQAAPSLDRLIPEISDEMLAHAAAPIRRDPR